MAQSPEKNPSTTEVIRYDLGWRAINAMLRAGRSLSGHERNCCFLNTGGQRFANVSAAAGLDYVDDGRVLALSDWDYDGDIDFWISNRSGPQVRYLRNDAGPDHHFIALRLQGVRSNRDAIGARVTVEVQGRAGATRFRQTQTLRAGDGYLSQSSKWLHFGLGEATRVERVVVRWPSGIEQMFEDLECNRWYQLVERQNQLKLWTPPVDGFQRLAASQFEAPPISDRARILLLKPLPLPDLLFEDSNGAQQSLTSSSPRPLLVNLWATWCSPCLEELSQWNTRAAELEAAGLRVIAINIDEEQEASRRTAVANIVSRLQLQFEHGLGSEDLATTLDMLQRSLLSRERPLPIPCSFLIDRQGRLRVVYKGPVTVDTLLKDTRLLTAEPAEILAAATPFQGRWRSPPGGSTPLQLALKLVEGGDAPRAQQYIGSLLRQRKTNPEYVSASLLNLYGAIFVDQQQLREAVAAFTEAIKLEPGNRQARMELGEALLRVGNGEQAAFQFEEVLRSNPDDPELLYKLGLAQMQQGKLTVAKQNLQRSSQLRTSPVVHWQLGNIHVATGAASEAIEQYERALQLKPELITSANNLAWLLATSDDIALRDGERAVYLAEQICSSEQGGTPGNLDTLATAYAEAGQFEKATRTAREAMKLALEQDQQDLEARIRRRLTLFEKGVAFHERLGP